MKERNRHLWLVFSILFLASFDMHAQTPFLSPYMKSLNASAMMIGVLLGAYSMSNLGGNLIAGPFLDHFSKKVFISSGLLMAGVLLTGHAFVRSPESLLGLRLLLGFVMAFVTPACFALLGQAGKTMEEQGKVMAKNGMVLTGASIVSPAVGGYLAGHLGYQNSFLLLGGIMATAGLVALLFLPGKKREIQRRGRNSERPDGMASLRTALQSPQLYPAYLSGFSLMFSQGTILYEIPLMMQERGFSPTMTGHLFSVMGAGSLFLLCQFWLMRRSPFVRMTTGIFGMGLVMYVLAVQADVPLWIPFFAAGACLGIVYPAKATMLTQGAPHSAYGSVFSLSSAVLSVGAIAGPLVAGYLDDGSLSFFVSFTLLMATSIGNVLFMRTNKQPRLIP